MIKDGISSVTIGNSDESLCTMCSMSVVVEMSIYCNNIRNFQPTTRECLMYGLLHRNTSFVGVWRGTEYSSMFCKG